MIEAIRVNIERNHVWHCLDCGKCSAVCPITKWETRKYTSPRVLVEKALGGLMDEILEDHLLVLVHLCL